MVQTAFSVGDEADLTTALGNISLPSGIDVAPNTVYTITLTAPIALTANAVLDLDTGSSLTLEGDALFASGFVFTVTGAVTADLNFTGTITLDGGSVDNVVITENGGGTVIAGNFTGQIVGTTGDGGDNVVNAGSITYTGTAGAIEFDTGTSSVDNTGNIIDSNALGLGVVLGAGTVDNGTTNSTTGLISGGDYGIQINGAGVVNNDATITGTSAGATGVYVGSGTVNNGTETDTTALIDGGVNGIIGVWVGSDTGIVNNFGTISDAGEVAVYLGAGGTVTNGSTADTTALLTAASEGVLVNTPDAGTVYNYGTITADDDSVNSAVGIYLEAGGTVESLGSLSAIDGLDWGIFAGGAAAYVQNAGSILAPGASGFGVDLGAGGTVVNGLASGSAATIQGTEDGVRIAAGVAGSGALVQNEGTIIGDIAVDFLSGAVEAAGTVVNDGLIESTASVSPYAVAFGDGDERLVLDAGGNFVGAVLGSDVLGATTTLELASGTSGTLSGLANGAGTVTDTAGTFDFSEFSTIAVDAGASWTISNPGSFPTVTDAGNLTIASGATVGLVQLLAGGTVTVQGSATSAQTVQLVASAVSTVALGAPSSATPGAFGAVIDTFGINGTIDLLNVPDTAITFKYAGSTLDVISNDGTVAVLDVPGPFSSDSFTPSSDGAVGTFITTNVTPCLTADTAVRTVGGDVLVQDLCVGDVVVCAGGGVRPVVWIGRRTVDVALHPSPEDVRPVRIAAGALEAGVPGRDLLVSPDHAMLLDGKLVAARLLVNGASVARETRLRRVTYFHVELNRHDILLAEGAPAETYLDTGNRASFENAGLPVRLHPDFPGDQSRREAGSCAPFVTAPDAVEPIWRKLAARAQALGWTLPEPPRLTDDADLHIRANGRRIDPVVVEEACAIFALPACHAPPRLVSRATRPSDISAWHDDRRRLGVRVRQLTLRQGSDVLVIPMDHPELARGWWPAEPDGGRWTDGDATLMPMRAGLVEVQLAGHMRHRMPDAAPQLARSSIR
jgi:hypothetical protein